MSASAIAPEPRRQASAAATSKIELTRGVISFGFRRIRIVRESLTPLGVCIGSGFGAASRRRYEEKGNGKGDGTDDGTAALTAAEGSRGRLCVGH